MTTTREEKALLLVARLLNPEDLAHSATPEIRDAARKVLGYAPVETGRHRNAQVPPRANPGPVAPQPQQKCRTPIIPQPEPERRYPERRLQPGQSRMQSLIESLTNVAIGYGVALVSQLVIFPQFGIHIPLSTNIEIGLWFTAVSVARSYVVRRWFNAGEGVSS